MSLTCQLISNGKHGFLCFPLANAYTYYESVTGYVFTTTYGGWGLRWNPENWISFYNSYIFLAILAHVSCVHLSKYTSSLIKWLDRRTHNIIIVSDYIHTQTCGGPYTYNNNIYNIRMILTGRLRFGRVVGPKKKPKNMMSHKFDGLNSTCNIIIIFISYIFRFQTVGLLHAHAYVSSNSNGRERDWARFRCSSKIDTI